MDRVQFDPYAGKAGRHSLPGCWPTARLVIMRTANRWILSWAAAMGWALSWAQPAFA
jgi:hypothetical protein